MGKKSSACFHIDCFLLGQSCITKSHVNLVVYMKKAIITGVQNVNNNRLSNTPEKSNKTDRIGTVT